MPNREEYPLRGTDLVFPPRVFEGASPEDVPILEKVAMTLSVACSKTITATLKSRAQVTLSEDESEYTLTVKMPNDSAVDFDAVHSVWSAAPVNIIAVVISSWRDEDTNVLYLTASAVMRRVRSALSTRFVMLQEMRRSIRESRSTLHDARDGHRLRSLLLNSDQENTTDAANDSIADRTPWNAVKNQIDRDVVQSVVMLCKKMSPNVSGARFWNNISVRENVHGRPDRLMVRWKLPHNTIADALIGASLRIRHPESIERINFLLDPASRDSKQWCPILIEITLFSVACDVVQLVDACTVNIFSTMRNSEDPNNTGIVKIAGPSQGSASETDPVTLAVSTIADTRRYNSKRSRSAMEATSTANATASPTSSEIAASKEDDESEPVRPAKIRKTNHSSHTGFFANLLETLGL